MPILRSYSSGFAVLALLASAAACGDDTSTTGSGGGSTSTTTTSTTTSTTTTGSGGGGGTTGTGGSTTGTGGTGGTGGSTTGTGGTGGMAGTGGGGGSTTGTGGGGGTVGTGGGGGGGGGTPACAIGSGPVTPGGGVYTFGDLDTNNAFIAKRFTYPGPTATTLPLMGLTGGNALDALAASPDQTKIAVAGRNTNIDSRLLYIYAADGSGSPTLIADGALAMNTQVTYDDLAFSPDGTMLAYTANSDTGSGRQVYVVAVTGGTPKLVSQSFGTMQSAFHLVWAPDSQHLAYIADASADAVNGAYIVDVTAATPTPIALVPENMLTATQNVSGAGLGVAFDSMCRVYFKSDYQVDNTFRLYRTALDGTGLEQVPGSGLMNNNNVEVAVGAWGISHDGTKVAFGAATFANGTGNLEQVYVLPLAGGTAVAVSNVLAAPLGANSATVVSIPIAWSPDGTKLAVAADWTVDDDRDIYVLPTGNTPGGVRVFGTSVANGDAVAVGFGNDGMHLYAVADYILNNETELFATADFTTANQTLATILLEDAISMGDVVDTGLVLQP